MNNVKALWSQVNAKFPTVTSLIGFESNVGKSVINIFVIFGLSGFEWHLLISRKSESGRAPLVPPFTVSASLLSRSELVLPATVRLGHGILRPDHDLSAFLDIELRTPKLDALYHHLWLAGLPAPARSLLRQRLMGRTIALTDRPDEHLVWHDNSIFVKPLPDYLLSHAFWEQHLCQNTQLYASAVGFLLSYAWLVRYRSDFEIAKEATLLPGGFNYAAWTRFVGEVISSLDLETMSQVDRRYRFGELRLSRLNSLTRLRAILLGHGFVHGHMNFPTRSGIFFGVHFGWLLTAFAYTSVVLSALQVGLGTGFLGGSVPFQRLSYGITLVAIAGSFGSALAVLFVWLVLFPYYVISTRSMVRKIERDREKPGSANAIHTP